MLSQPTTERILHQFDCIDLYLTDLSEAELKMSFDGKWSIHQNLAHLGRYHEVFLDRLYKITYEEEPSFERYVADDDPGFIEWNIKSHYEIIKATQRKRTDLAEKASKLSDEQLLRVGIHPTFGRLSIVMWLEFFLLHEAHHFFTIFKLAGRIRKERVG